ncbi:MAG: molybdenum ABC transporter ATP-binding protein [Pseudomonadota bacterium]
MTLQVAIRARLGELDLDVAFEAPAGITCLFGRSGAGKTTVIHAIAGLLRPDSGRIVADGLTLFDSDSGVDLPAHRRRVGYVFQEGRLFPHLSVRANLMFGRWFAPRAAPRPGLAEVTELLGIADLLHRRPGGLSGGEKQRVAIGRALLSGPRLLLMDEPLASLDEARKAEILPYVERLRDELGLPIVYVSHSLPEVARLATTVVALSGGRVLRAGPAAEVLSDAAAFPVTGRQQAGAILPARVVRREADGLSELAVSGGRLWVPNLEAPPGAALRVRVRARDVTLADRRPEGLSALNVLEAVVERVDDGEGAIVELLLRCGDDRLRARVTRRSLQALSLTPGARCWAILKAVAVSRRDLGAFEEREG